MRTRRVRSSSQPAEDHRRPRRTDDASNSTSISKPRLHRTVVGAKGAELEAKEMAILKEWQRYGPWDCRVLAARRPLLAIRQLGSVVQFSAVLESGSKHSAFASLTL
ncbi:hypothetical protein CCMA1212_006496 [Trichoderma ghanense]|uniref:Uncharacterized protein n=1 Tax=Trichoderma ghanense TaxID=65468 RepID=A0ABY2H207_9HYPO